MHENGFKMLEIFYQFQVPDKVKITKEETYGKIKDWFNVFPKEVPLFKHVTVGAQW
ncbi:hypothetical protein [Bacillus sp. FSL K6-3431]|uniref:hypothetical protein n=1 Tax=Bacillus sp. FSL K6-3431 TaxID=2921500 RepID=UPI0030FBBA30